MIGYSISTNIREVLKLEFHPKTIKKIIERSPDPQSEFFYFVHIKLIAAPQLFNSHKNESQETNQFGTRLFHCYHMIISNNGISTNRIITKPLPPPFRYRRPVLRPKHN